MKTYIRWFRDIRLADIGLVGGKTASLGELYSQLQAAGVRVPDGFAVTAEAYRALLDAGGLRHRLAGILENLRVERRRRRWPRRAQSSAGSSRARRCRRASRSRS